MKLPPKKIAGLCGGLIFVGGLITIPVVTIHYNKYDLWYKEKVEEKVYEVAWEQNGSILILKNWVTINHLSKYLSIIDTPTPPVNNFITNAYQIKNSIGFNNFVSCFDNGVNLIGSYYNSNIIYVVAIVHEQNNKNNYGVAISITNIENSKLVTFASSNYDGEKNKHW